ncbi:protein SGT1 homolog [Wolffia australiana]
MASDLKLRANAAFVDDNFELAAEIYTQGLDMNPNDAELYADRAQANIKLMNYTEAVSDANRAIELDRSLSKAYLRKGIACMKLEEFQTAKAALEAGFALSPGESRFAKLIKECDVRIAEEMNALSSTNKSPTCAPELVAPVPEKTCESGRNEEKPLPKTPTGPRFRHDFYNTTTEIVLSIYAKGIPEVHIAVEFGEQILSVSIEVPGEEPYHFQPRLFGKIVPSNSRYKVLGSKIEIRLSKVEPITWTSLEFSRDKSIVQRVNIPSGSSTAPKPSYPSSKPKKTDWDKLEAQVKKEEKDEKLDGDAALNKLFQDIFRDADDDMRRAMQKSYVESNGTVLSTNWKEVGAKTVTGSPPDSMEMKKWEY